MTSADVRLCVGATQRETLATNCEALGFQKRSRVIAVKGTVIVALAPLFVLSLQVPEPIPRP